MKIKRGPFSKDPLLQTRITPTCPAPVYRQAGSVGTGAGKQGYTCVLKRLVQSVLIHLRTCSGGEVGEDRHYGVQARSRYLDSTTICLG
jgi:hypothetical protein